MGKRKRAKPPPKKAKPKVSQVFDCPFCGKSSSCGACSASPSAGRARPPQPSGTQPNSTCAPVRSHAAGVRLGFDHQVGNITCDSCHAKYEMQINRLTEPIDVYSEWMDMAEQVNSGDVATAGGEDEDEED